jgi:rfaE bifunctional protein kinase chain/domain
MHSVTGRQAPSAVIAKKYADSVAKIRAQAGSGCRIAFISGNFNVVHPGHLRMFKFAREIADFVVVAVNRDGGPGVNVPAQVRMEGVRSISLIDHALLLDGSPDVFIRALKPDFVVKGREFETRKNPELAAVESYGGSLVFSSGEMRFTSVGLLHREYFGGNFSPIKKFPEYLRRHSFDHATVKSTLERFSGLRVFVIGDLIIDDYITCDPLGMSQEDPSIVVTPIETKTFVGGAGIVAAHAHGLGADVHYCTVVGDDDTAKFALQSLKEWGVEFDFFVDGARPTTRKQRFRALNKTLLRVNHLRQNPIDSKIQDQMLATVEEHLAHTDLILFSCFNYGCLPQNLVDAIAERAAARGIMMAADSQASSQMADISRFRGMALITPTEREARLALRDFDSGLAFVSERLQETAAAKSIIISLGSEGMLIRGPKDSEYHSDRLPAFNTAPKDVAGAGDSLFTAAAMSLCVGRDIWEGAYIGALAAALQVSRVGNSPLRGAELVAEIDTIDADDDAFQY